MSNDTLPDEVDLPHNAWFDSQTGVLTFAIDRITMSFDINEFMAFAKEIDDIATILSQMVVREHESCPTCGTELEILSINPPSPEDFN